MIRPSSWLRRSAPAILWLVWLTGWQGSPAAAEPVASDLRELTVGMPLSELPGRGYAEFTCIASPDQQIAGWDDYRRCPADGDGRREIGFRYDDNAQHDTRVAGQPVKLSATLAPDGALYALHMRTDATARLFQRKAGYMFGLRVKERYGDGGWTCRNAPLAADEEPIGGVFVHEHCEKTVGPRHLAIDRDLFRKSDEKPDHFTSSSSFTVSLADGS